MATGANDENGVVFLSNFEGEHLNINLSRMNETNHSPLLNWMHKNKKLLLGVITAVALSIIINCTIFYFYVVLSSSDTSENSVQLQPRIDKQNETKSASIFPCPSGWTAYTDLKCIQVIDLMETYEGAVELCRKANSTSTLLDIQTDGEQLFMEKLIFTDLHLFNSVWLGGQLSTDTTDDQKRQYSNWAEGNPSLGNDRKCIQMLADHHAEGTGKWISVRCQQKGAVVCQQLQNWSPIKLQENLIKTTITVEHQQKEIGKLKNVTIPVGFIYVQLPKQPSPAVLWPHLNWEDISVEYANVFFRVFGNKTEPFGVVQNETSPRLSRVTIDSEEHFFKDIYEVVPGKESDGIPLKYSVPEYQSSQKKSMYLLVNKAEVRPENMAVKIWKRF